METSREIPQNKQQRHTIRRKPQNLNPPEQGRKWPKNRIRQYKDEITQKGQKLNLNLGTIQIQPTEHTRKKCGKYIGTPPEDETLD